MPMETVVAFSLIDVLFLITIFFMFSLQTGEHVIVQTVF